MVTASIVCYIHSTYTVLTCYYLQSLMHAHYNYITISDLLLFLPGAGEEGLVEEPDVRRQKHTRQLINTTCVHTLTWPNSLNSQ